MFQRSLRQLSLRKAAPQSRQRLQRRHASTSQTAQDARSVATRTKNLALGTTILAGLTFGYYYMTDTRSGVHRWVSVPLLKLLYPDAEDAHSAGAHLLRGLYDAGLHPRDRAPDTGDLQVEVFGHTLANPIGTSAGIDKDANVPDALLALGPAVVEVGGVTPLPQEGNARPRVFRLPSQEALVNRYGLNSAGADRVAQHLRERLRRFARDAGLGTDAAAERAVLDGKAGVPPGSLTPGRLLAVQVAKNKATPDADHDAVRADYVSAVTKLARYADIVVVNVSSPNTPGLRSLQAVEPLTHILTGVVEAARKVDRASRPPAVMVKVSPDEDSEAQVLGIAQAVWASGVDGVIVGNTTKSRPAPLPTGYTLPHDEQRALQETGGFSGPHTFAKTRALIAQYRSILDEALQAHPEMNLAPKVIFASGGITTGKQALEALEAGASVAQVYTAVVYSGVGTVSRLKDEMRSEMRRRVGSKDA